MKLKNLIAGCMTLLFLGWSGGLLADGGSDALAMETVNVNEADAETIARVLVGVGLSRAEAIVTYREENGKFYAAEELTAVRGIGKSTVAKNEHLIALD